MIKLLLALAACLLMITVFYLVSTRYSFAGGQCGGFTVNPKACLPGLECRYPGPHYQPELGISIRAPSDAAGKCVFK